MKISRPSQRLAAVLAVAWLAGPFSTPVEAGTMDGKSPLAEVDEESNVHFLFQFDFSDAYITPRGLYVENQGLVFQPLLLSFWNIYSNDDAFLNDITVTAGVWNSFHTRESGADPGNWNEVDPIFGVAYGLGEYLKFETNFTAFRSMVESYPTSYHMELKLSVNDSSWMGPFALNPYLGYWQELDNKATVVFNPATSSESYYFTLGVNPGFKVGDVKFEFPTYVNLVGEDFYQQFSGAPGGDGAAVFGSEAKVSVPLKFIPKDYGFWNAYAGVKYYHLDNAGLLDGNQVLGAQADRDTDLFQVHGGISIFY